MRTAFLALLLCLLNPYFIGNAIHGYREEVTTFFLLSHLYLSFVVSPLRLLPTIISGFFLAMSRAEIIPLWLAINLYRWYTGDRNLKLKVFTSTLCTFFLMSFWFLKYPIHVGEVYAKILYSNEYALPPPPTLTLGTYFFQNHSLWDLFLGYIRGALKFIDNALFTLFYIGALPFIVGIYYAMKEKKATFLYLTFLIPFFVLSFFFGWDRPIYRFYIPYLPLWYCFVANGVNKSLLVISKNSTTTKFHLLVIITYILMFLISFIIVLLYVQGLAGVKLLRV